MKSKENQIRDWVELTQDEQNSYIDGIEFLLKKKYIQIEGMTLEQLAEKMYLKRNGIIDNNKSIVEDLLLE
jgi:hypothetical protein